MDNVITRQVFVGRKDELEKIRAAIEATSVQVVNIQGDGGVGKTSLLTKVWNDYKERTDLCITGVLDFFSTASHTGSGFLKMMIAQFPREAFENYRTELEKYETVRLAGMPGSIIKDHMLKAFQAFHADLNRLAESRKVVLLVDTFEVVQDAKGPWWLALMSQVLANAGDKTKGVTFIIAGRRNDKWRKDLENRFGRAITYLELTNLDMDAVEELCQKIVEEGDVAIPTTEREKLNLLTEGRPLLLTLALDWRRREGVLLDHLTRTTAKYELAQLQRMPADELKKVRRNFEAELVDKFHELGKTDRVILLMAYVYKRFDADILAYLEGMAKEEADKLLEEMKWWSFIKYDPRAATYQLHDKMRDMMSEHVWAELDPGNSQRRELASRMTVYYEQLLKEWMQKIEQKMSERGKAAKRGDTAAEAAARRDETLLRAERDVFAAQYAYYDILSEPEEGLLRCGEEITEDIWAFSMGGYRLKQKEREDALKVLETVLPEYVTDLERARVLTVIEQNRKEALDLLEELDNPRVFSLSEVERSTHEADVKIYQSLNICYGLPPLSAASPQLRGLTEKWVGKKSPFERAAEIAQEAVENLQEKEKLPLTDLERRAVHRSLARVYNVQAYAFARMGRFMESINANQKCLSYARRSGLWSAQSHALNDLAFNYARLGQFLEAMELAQEGLEIRERLGLNYFVGLSLNTLGLIKFLDDKPHRGVADSERALHVFEQLEDRRGLGLAHLALGQLNGRIGEVRPDEKFFEESLKHYQEAEKIFSTRDERGQLVEPARLPQTYEWLGVLYLMWGRLSGEMGEDPSKIAERLTQADTYFGKAIKGYEGEERKWEQAIALERWARVSIDRAEFLQVEKEDKQKELSLAEEKLEQAETIALAEAPEVELKPLGEGKTREKVETVHPEYQLVLGKIERLRGRLAFDQVRGSQSEAEINEYLGEAAKHFVRACAYLEEFSEEARELQDTLKMVGGRIRLLEYSGIALFEENIKKIQEEYGLQEYRRLPDRVKRIASVEPV